MNERKHNVITTPKGGNTLWPDGKYYEKLEKIKLLIGQKIYLIEATVTEINAGVHHTGQAYTLLSIVDYPQPDHKTGLLPHNIIIDDGRGINLGRIIQISTESAFNPPEKNIAYKNDHLLNDLTLHWKRIDKQSLEHASKAMLASILNKPDMANQSGKATSVDELVQKPSDTNGEKS